MTACPNCPSSKISDPVIDILLANGASNNTHYQNKYISVTSMLDLLHECVRYIFQVIIIAAQKIGRDFINIYLHHLTKGSIS